jgi:hypothetical protein
MRQIPEERLLEDMIDLLDNCLPPKLHEFEEMNEDGEQLPPMNYVGAPEDMPIGNMEPYALVDVTDGSYTMKDRIIRNNVFKVKIELNLQKKKLVWRYFTALRNAFNESEHSERWRIREEKHEKSGKMGIEVVER